MMLQGRTFWLPLGGAGKDIQLLYSIPGRERPREQKALNQTQAADLELGLGASAPGLSLLKHLAMGYSWRQ